MEKYEDIKEIEGYPKIPVGRAENITNKKFGRYTALYRTISKNKSNRPCWVCLCDCGNIRVVETTHLKNGTSQSCGCITKELLSKKSFIDLTGKRFNKLLVLERGPDYILPSNNKKRIPQFYCKCDCGTEKLIRSDHLRDGTTQSCGCLGREISSEMRLVDLVGKTFGELLVLERASNRQWSNSSSTYWKCKCSCGKIIEVQGANLKSGNTTNCGCKQIKSKGEDKIKELLLKQCFSFDQEKSFKNCRFQDTNALARFDFYVNNKYLIEFDGEQHFNFSNSGWMTEEKFLKTQEHDAYKNQWCKENNIPLIRIPYTHLKDLCIEDLLLETTEYRVV